MAIAVDQDMAPFKGPPQASPDILIHEGAQALASVPLKEPIGVM